jgi:glutathione-independent formaldehyde dehydrogenase
VGPFFGKGSRVRFGRTHDRRYTMVAHHGTLDDAPELYRQFDRRDHGVVKAVVRP